MIQNIKENRWIRACVNGVLSRPVITIAICTLIFVLIPALVLPNYKDGITRIPQKRHFYLMLQFVGGKINNINHILRKKGFKVIRCEVNTSDDSPWEGEYRITSKGRQGILGPFESIEDAEKTEKNIVEIGRQQPISWKNLEILYLYLRKTKEINGTVSPQKQLTKGKTKELFSNFVDPESKQRYKLDDIRVGFGSFTGKHQQEALVSFYDDNRLYWQLPSELWLLKYEEGWKLERQVARSQGLAFTVVDINSDGQNEILIYEGTTQQGLHSATNSLVSLDEFSTHDLYSNHEIDTQDDRNESREKRFFDVSCGI